MNINEEREWESFDKAERKLGNKVLAVVTILFLVIVFVTLFGTEAKAGTVGTGTMQAGGIERTFTYYVPDAYQGQPVPLMVMLHGAHGSGDRLLDQEAWVVEADLTGMVVIYPDGVMRPIGRLWNIYDFDGTGWTDDVAFIDQLMDWAEGAFSIDMDQEYLSGHSDGAMMVDSYLLMSQQADRLAASVHYKGGWMTYPLFCNRSGLPCDPLADTWEPLPWTHAPHVQVRGTDEKIPLLNLSPDNVLTLDLDDRAFWTWFDGCTEPMTVVDGIYTVDSYLDCPYSMIEIAGGEHPIEAAELSKVWEVIHGADRTGVTAYNLVHAREGRAFWDRLTFRTIGSGDLLGGWSVKTTLYECGDGCFTTQE